MESNQGPRTERLTEASPPGRATEAHGDARAPLTTKPSSSSPSVGIKKAPTGRASSPSLSPRSIKPPPSRRPPSVASSSAGGGNRKVPKAAVEVRGGSPLNFEVRRQRSERRTRPTWASCSSSSWRCARALGSTSCRTRSTLAAAGAPWRSAAPLWVRSPRSGGGRNGERRAGTAQPVGTGRCGSRRMAPRKALKPPSARRLPPRPSSRASIHSSCVRSRRRTWRQQPQRPARRIERRGARYGAWRGRGERGGRRGAVFARLND